MSFGFFLPGNISHRADEPDLTIICGYNITMGGDPALDAIMETDGPVLDVEGLRCRAGYSLEDRRVGALPVVRMKTGEKALLIVSVVE